ncbi:hypothetical protein C8Q76DRAFT_690745 [Earliella scabrosa]|nr:hypothetical protein C8Q76DRAFT_690745 [Earliella scabrosa]
MSAYPAYVMGTLCIVGGITGFARTRSIPSLVAGVGWTESSQENASSPPCSVGALYLYSADSIRKGTANGLELALGASALLLLSSLPRAAKGPVPAVLSVTSAASALYYGKTVLAVRSS